jgi:hypothetical protein
VLHAPAQSAPPQQSSRARGAPPAAPRALACPAHAYPLRAHPLPPAPRPGGQGGGSFYIPLFSVLNGFTSNHASALSAGVVFMGCTTMVGGAGCRRAGSEASCAPPLEQLSSAPARPAGAQGAAPARHGPAAGPRPLPCLAWKARRRARPRSRQLLARQRLLLNSAAARPCPLSALTPSTHLPASPRARQVTQAVFMPHPRLSARPQVDYPTVLMMTPSLMLGLTAGVVFNRVVSQWLLDLLVISIWSWSCVQLGFTYTRTRALELGRLAEAAAAAKDAAAAEAAAMEAGAAGGKPAGGKPEGGLGAAAAAAAAGGRRRAACGGRDAAGAARRRVAWLRRWAAAQPWQVISAIAFLFGVFIVCQVVRGEDASGCKPARWELIGGLAGFSAAATVAVSCLLISQQRRRAALARPPPQGQEGGCGAAALAQGGGTDRGGGPAPMMAQPNAAVLVRAPAAVEAAAAPAAAAARALSVDMTAVAVPPALAPALAAAAPPPKPSADAAAKNEDGVAWTPKLAAAIHPQ